ncbi:MAG: mannose-1-phosphate guanylyltransferase [Flavobacteriaceae bacterium]|nr:mannose-1-phosphate guanylyltransferase [Flavobacteriaceae bacterium]
MNTNYYAVIMAGGVGSRLWPVSTKAQPKQFHDFMNTGLSFLQSTFHRITSVVDEKNIFILTNAKYTEQVTQQLAYLHQHRLIPETAMRNTAPCILLAALKIYKENPDGVMLVAPSDHLIKKEPKFWDDVQQSLQKAETEDVLITLGIKPTQPNTGYGYIEYEENTSAFKPVKQFREKPDLATAKRYLQQGNFLWNAGIFIWSVRSIIEQFKQHQPAMHALLHQGNDVLNTDKEHAFIEKNYASCENISIDYAILEKATNVQVLPASFEWNDLGTWTSIHAISDKDEHANTVIGTEKSLLKNAENNLIFANSDKKVIVHGLKNYIIVDKNDTLLIIPMAEDQDIKQISASLK